MISFTHASRRPPSSNRPVRPSVPVPALPAMDRFGVCACPACVLHIVLRGPSTHPLHAGTGGGVGGVAHLHPFIHPLVVVLSIHAWRPGCVRSVQGYNSLSSLPAAAIVASIGSRRT